MINLLAIGCVAHLSALANPITALAYSPDGLRIAVGAVRRIEVCDSTTLQVQMVSQRVAGPARSIAWSPDGMLIAVGSGDPAESGKVTLINAQGPASERVISCGKEPIEALAFSPDNQRLVAGSADNLVRMIDVGTAAVTKQMDDHNGRVTSVSWPQPDRFATASSDKMIKLWNASTLKVIVNVEASETGVVSMAALPDAQTFVSGTGDGKLTWWTCSLNKAGEPIRNRNRIVDAHVGSITAVQIAVSGKRLATVGIDKLLRLYSANGNAIKQWKDVPSVPFAVAVSPDGTHVVTGDMQGALTLYSDSADVPATMRVVGGK